MAPTEPRLPSPTPTVIAATPTAIAAAPLDPALVVELDRILDETVADGAIPGAALAVTLPRYQPWSGASGLADRDQGRPMEPTTLVRIASLSKIYTAVVVLQLVEEGRIALDAPVATWLPDLLANGDTITVRMLLNHRTGLYDFLEDPNFLAQAYSQPERVWAPRELVAYAQQFPPAFQPGAEGAWDYSSTNYVILGMLAEQVTGNTLGDEMRRRIFEPLELDQTDFAYDQPISGLAWGYRGSADRTNVAMSFGFATANLVSTVEDVQRFAQALFSNDLLQPETLAAMYSFVNGKGQYNMPALEYGLGLMRNRLPVGPGPGGATRPAGASTVLGHTGGFAGFRAVVWFAPESEITIALSVNQGATDPNTLATKVLDAILAWQGR